MTKASSRITVAGMTVAGMGNASAVLVLLFALLVAGCSMRGGLRTSTPSAEPAASIDSGDFTVAANMLDTWNTIGQILVRTDGVIYQSRSQMLGLYEVRYRGEQILIHTKALVMEQPTDGLRTRVTALDANGGLSHSATAIALLKMLAQTVPTQVDRYHMPIKLPPVRKSGQKSKRAKR